MLKNNDNVLFNLIEKEAHREETEIQLIASENYTSLDVMEAN
jgi:glycine hydroxymethyltransferase